MQLRFNIEREKQNKLIADNYENDYCLLQFHSQIEIYLIDEGEMEMLINGKFQRLLPGHVSVSLSYDAHAYKTPVSSKSSILHIPPHMCEDFINLVKGKRLKNPYITDPEAYRQIKACHEALKQKDIGYTRQFGYIYIILGIILKTAVFEDADQPINFDLATRILFYINDNFKNDISPASIASHLGYNQSYVSRYFKASCGISLVHYLTAVRLKNAVMLMQEGKHDITYCAFESGFSSMRTFYRSFHDEFSCTPKEYLKSIHT